MKKDSNCTNEEETNFSIFDGNLEKVYKFPPVEEIDNYFEKDGILSNVFDNYEYRSGQVEFAKSINKSFRESSILISEAETGIGKTYAYLVVSALYSILNDEVVGVSSNTNALIDQLMNKDLPAIENLFEKKLKYTSLKGISHYICLRKLTNQLQRAVIGQVTHTNKEKEIATSLMILLSYINGAKYEDIGDLSLNFGGLYSSQFTCESSECYKKKCPFYKKYCFTHGNRQLAASTNIVVTNHSMLFNNCAADGAILPPIKRWIVDEAHNCEEWARHAFTNEVTSNQLKVITEKSSDIDHNKSLINKVINDFSKKHNETLFYALAKKITSVGVDLAIKATELAETMISLSELLPKGQITYDSENVWISREKFYSSCFVNFCTSAKSFVEVAKKQQRNVGDMLTFLDDYKDVKSSQGELQGYKNEIIEAQESLIAIVKNQGNTHVISASIPKKDSNLPYVVTAQPLSIANAVNRHFLSDCENIVFTSATLSILGKFENFEQAMGIVLQEKDMRKVERQIVASPFNFNDNMRVLPIENLPAPALKSQSNYQAYIDEISSFLIDCHIANGGSCLTLFASVTDMLNCYKIVEPALSGRGLRLMCQKGTSTRGKIINEFRNDEASSLFAVRSFWEGFDAPGDTLRCVIIVKLPFTNMSDPLYKQLSDMPEINSFTEYSLPRAIIQTKQACGRLIRSSKDRGFVVIADPRVIKKGYGAKFLNSLQTNNITKVGFEDAISIISHA